MSSDFFTIRNEANETAVIDINGYIGRDWWEDEDKENTLQRIQKALKEIKELKAKTITVNIFSLGGDVHHAFAIHDALVAHSAAIITNIIGFCASAATIIAMSGDVRKMSDNSLFLIHKCMTSVWGANENDLQAKLDANKLVDERIKNLYKKVGVSSEKVEELMNEDNGYGKWITAQEAKDYGFITEITNEMKQVASVSADYFAKSKLPAIPAGYENLIQNQNQNQTAPVGFWENIKNEIKELFSIHNQINKSTNNQINMKNTFPLIAAMFALADDAQFDKEKGFVLNETQLKDLEAELLKITNLQTEKTNLTASVSQKDTKIAELQAIVDKIPAGTQTVVGGDPSDDDANSFENSMKDDPFYKGIAKETGKKL